MEDSLKDRLKLIRKKKGLTQDELAKLAGISTVSVSNYERGIRTPDKFTLNQLSTALKFPVDILEHGIPIPLQKNYNYDFFINADYNDMESYSYDARLEAESEQYEESEDDLNFIKDLLESLRDLDMFEDLHRIAENLRHEKLNIINSERLRQLKNKTTDLELLKYDPFEELKQRKEALKDYHIYFGNTPKARLYKIIHSDDVPNKNELKSILDDLEK